MHLIDDAAAIELLVRMVRTQSFSYQESALAEDLRIQAGGLGFDARVDEAGNWIAEWGDSGPVIALVGHLDTVTGFWPVEVRDRVLHGRGSVDAKGPLACFLAAASRAAVEAEAAGLPLRLRVIGATEEEVPSSKGARHLAKDQAPDYLIVGEPSGWDGVTLGYKGYLKIELRIDGARSHTAHQGPTIAARACSLWQRFEREVERWNRGRRRVFDQLLPALLDIRCEGDGRNAAARLSIAIRLPVDLDGAATLDWLHSTLGNEASIESRDEPVPAWEGPRTGVVARALGRAILTRDARPRFQVKTGTADLNILAPVWGCPAVAYGPGDAALDHRPDEHIVLDEYLAAIEILKDGLLELARTSASGLLSSSGAGVS